MNQPLPLAALRPDDEERVRRLAEPPPIAERIADDAQALAAAGRVAELLRAGSAQRDRDRLLPWDELDAVAHNGLLAIRVPRAHGGAEVSWATVAEVVTQVSAADASIGQLFLSILLATSVIASAGRPEQQALFFGRILAGHRWGNGHAEGGGRQAGVTATRITRRGDTFIVDGSKFYSTGAYYSHWMSIGCVDDEGRHVTAVLSRHAKGLTIVDDWDGFGQRTTASGSLQLDGVEVDATHVIESQAARSDPAAAVFGVTDLVHAAVDLGIARATVDDTLAWLRDHARAYTRVGVSDVTEDPYVLDQLGDVITRLHVAEAVLVHAARLFDDALRAPGEAAKARATIALSEARIVTTEAALLATNKIFQLGGASATRAAHGLDRHWRNARTHTVHDPVHWRFSAIGRHHLQR